MKTISQYLIRSKPLVWTSQRQASGYFTSWGEFFKGRQQHTKDQAKFGKDRSDAYRTEYEKEVKERSDLKLNWGIKNRWEQRALDDIIKNQDIKSIRFRDFHKIQVDAYGRNLQEFNSVDEIYYFMDNMFVEGFTEHHISIALDVFLRDAAKFKDADLQTSTFKEFTRELGRNLVSFTDQNNYVKAAKFMDLYCIEDKLLWVNMEMFLMKKEKMFSPKSYIQIMNHFASQQEGTRDFYDFYEFLYFSKLFENLNIHDFISLGYNFYLVHAGTSHFLSNYSEELQEKLDDKVTTFDLLRVMQTFSEISSEFSKLFIQLETIILKRYGQLTMDEMTCCACAFSISGFGSQYLFSMLESGIIANLANFDKENIKEICRGFVFSQRGTKNLHQIIMPRVHTVVQAQEFNFSELCYVLYNFNKKGVMTKQLASLIEEQIAKPLREINTLEIEQIALIVTVFCSTRSGSRDFHKLLETVILQRLEDLKKKPEVLHKIGFKFEESGLCSLDTLKVLKKHMLQIEIEKSVYY